MLDALKRVRDRFFGEGQATVSVPIFDGALTPNNLLEEAPVFAELPGLEDLAIGADGVLHAARGNEVLRFDASGAHSTRARFDAPVQALALCEDGGLAVASEGCIVFEGGAAHGKRLDGFAGQPLAGMNALHAAPDGKLLISQGSQKHPYAQWRHDLLEHGRSGRVLAYDPASGKTRVLASGLAYCHGVCSDGVRVLASESWAHRIVGIDGAGAIPIPLLSALPGYPARISPAPGGGFWLSLFAGRTQLIEFVLREDDFRAEMMRTIEPRYWLAPALSSGSDFREPLQGGGVKQMGILKPWAPPRSYGLLIRLGADLMPRYSLHSRVGGRHHGIVAAVEHGGQVFVLSKGSGRILRVAVAELNMDVNLKKGAV
jgi:hypothetical protein